MDLIFKLELLILQREFRVLVLSFHEKALEFAARGTFNPEQRTAIAALDQPSFIGDVLAAAALWASESGYLHRGYW
jgi:hypothetical protein